MVDYRNECDGAYVYTEPPLVASVRSEAYTQILEHEFRKCPI